MFALYLFNESKLLRRFMLETKFRFYLGSFTGNSEVSKKNMKLIEVTLQTETNNSQSQSNYLMHLLQRGSNTTAGA